MLEEAMALANKIPEGIRRTLFVKMLSEKFGIPESHLYEILRYYGKDRIKAEKNLKERIAYEQFPKVEEMLLSLMVHSPQLIPMISKEGIIEEFENPILQKIGEYLEVFYQKKGRLELKEVLGDMDDDLQAKLCEIAFRDMVSEGKDYEKIMKDCIQRIREKRLKRDEEELLKKIKEAEKHQRKDELERLLIERIALAKREKSLRR
jgi:hypothetical protein